MKIDSTSVVVAAKNQLASSVGNETVILGLAQGRYYGVNTVGARVWQIIQTPTAMAAIRDIIATEYEIDAARCESDLINLVHQMAEVRLVEVQGAFGP